MLTREVSDLPRDEVAAAKRKIDIPNLGLRDVTLTDSDKYYSKSIMEKEWSNLWTKVWTVAGRLSDLKVVGDWFRYDLGRESMIIVRSKDDRIQAFYNVCQHRGSRLVDKDFGSSSSFVCSFHSWSWNIDGSLKSITDRETFPENIICDNPGLTEIRVECWAGFVFVNLDPDAKPLTDYLGGLPQAIGPYLLDKMVIVKDYSALWPVNWKIGLDAFMEGYHAHARHPELTRTIDDFNFQYDFFGNGQSLMNIPFGTKTPRIKDRASLTKELCLALEAVGLDPADFKDRQPDVRAALIEAKREWYERHGIATAAFNADQLVDDGNYNIFPNITLNIHPEGVLVMRFRPHPSDPEQSLYDVWVLSVASDDPEFVLPYYMEVPAGTDLRAGAKRPERKYISHMEPGMGLVIEQDAEFLPLVQAGIQSKGFRGVRLSNQEIRLRYYYAEYDRYMEVNQ